MVIPTSGAFQSAHIELSFREGARFRVMPRQVNRPASLFYDLALLAEL